MLSNRKGTDKNEKGARKNVRAVDGEKPTTSKKSEKKPKLQVDAEKDTKVKRVVPERQSIDKTKALKGNHQIVANAKDLLDKRKVDDSSKVSAVKKSVVVRKSISKGSDTTPIRNNAAKKPLTSVTINSPKHKRKEPPSNSKQENIVRNDVVKSQSSVRSKNGVNEKHDINLNNHKRYRTRTLEPEEIKIIDKLVQNIEYSDNNVADVVDRKLVAQPKAFFVSLDEEQNRGQRSKELNISSNEKQNRGQGSKELNISLDEKQNREQGSKELNISSGEEHESKEIKVKQVKVNKEDENEALSYEDDFESYESDFDSFNSSDKSGKMSESDIDEVSSTTSGLSSLNKVKDDKIFDSGNYESGEMQKISNAKSEMRTVENLGMNNLKMENLPQSMASLSDEGFDENSAGPLSSMNNISILSKEVVKGNDKKCSYSQRARDLKGLIVLDHVKYFLFEMSPLSYDSFITIHGKSNMKQVMCQTNDDYIDEDVQTDSIPVENKWTQYPIEFSSNNITYDNEEQKNSMKNIFSPLEMYISQKQGCGSGSSIANTQIKSNLSHRTNFSKLAKFINKTGKCILNYLDDHQRYFNEDMIILKESSNNENHPYNDNEEYIYDIVKRRPLEKIQFSKTNPDIVLTMHPVNSENFSKNIDMCSIICIWFLKGNLLKPSRMLGSIGNIKCCEISKGLSGVVVAGLEDGNICAWNLKEQDMWFETLYSNMKTSDTSNQDGIDKELFRICSYHSGYDICKSSNQNRYMGGSCVDVAFSKSVVKNDLFTANQQIYLLQEFGLLTIWIVIHKQPAYKNVNNVDNYHSQWSTTSLAKTNVVDLNNSVFHNNLRVASSHKKTPTNAKASKDRRTKSGIMRAFADEEPDIEFDELITRKDQTELKEARNDVDPINKIICTIMKEHHVTGDVLVACNNCQILSYSPKSVRKNVNLYKCEDVGSCVTCIETPSTDLAFFFSSCSNNIVHLYAKKSTRPLRSFFYGQSETDIQAYKQFTLSYDFYNFSDSNKQYVDKSKTNFWIDWCESKSHMFFTFFADGTIALWDLFNSDVSPKMYFNYLINNDTGKRRFLLGGKILPVNQNRADAVKYLMILHLSDGQIQLHMLDEKHFKTKFNDEEKELKLLKTYFELL